MIDGTYNVFAKTPFGERSGQILMATNGDACTGDLIVAGKTAHLEGTVEGNLVTFTGSIKMPFPIGKLDFVVEGTVEGDTLSGSCQAKKFKFDITGTRV